MTPELSLLWSKPVVGLRQVGHRELASGRLFQGSLGVLPLPQVTKDPRHPVSLSLYKADPRGCTFQEPMGRFPCTAWGPTRLDSKLLQAQSHVFAQKSACGQRLGPRPTPQMVHGVPRELPLAPAATTFPARSLVRHAGRLLAREQVRLTLALGSFCCSCLSQAQSSFRPFFPIFAPRSPSQGTFCSHCPYLLHVYSCSYHRLQLCKWLICRLLSIVISKHPEQCPTLKQRSVNICGKIGSVLVLTSIY